MFQCASSVLENVIAIYVNIPKILLETSSTVTRDWPQLGPATRESQQIFLLHSPMLISCRLPQETDWFPVEPFPHYLSHLGHGLGWTGAGFGVKPHLTAVEQHSLPRLKLHLAVSCSSTHSLCTDPWTASDPRVPVINVSGTTFHPPSERKHASESGSQTMLRTFFESCNEERKY